jgi:hypothetical protein
MFTPPTSQRAPELAANADNQSAGTVIRASLVHEADDYVWPVQVRELAADAIRLVMNHGMVHGTTVELELCNPERDYGLRLPIQVLYAVKQPGGHFLVGAALGRRLTPAEINQLTGNAGRL